MNKLWRRTLFLILLASLALSSVGANPAQGQADVASAPRVIFSSPAQREVVGPGSSIRVTFDQAMNRASVEAALTIDPRVNGSLAWQDDTAFTFTPATMTRGQEYHLSIGTGAKSVAGLALEDFFRLTFQISPNLAVNQVIPAPSTQNVEAGATITVIFDRPVVPLVTSSEQANLPQPLKLNPAVEGKGEWLGTAIYAFRPAKPLAGGTLYTATIDGALKDVDGTPLDKPYSWTFTTVPPQILSLSPSANQNLVQLESEIVVQFNQPMDRTSTTAAFKVRNASNGADVAGSLTFSNNDATLVFKPASRLEMETRYQVSILGSARSAGGAATLTNPTTLNFNTVPFPRIVRTNPGFGQRVPPGSGASIEFNTPMNPQSFAGKVKVEPKPAEMSVGGGQSLYINFRSLPNTTYTVTLDAGVTDLYGNAIKEPFTFSYSTTDFPASFFLVRRDQVAVTSAYKPDTTMLAVATNITQIEGALSSLEIPEFLAMPWKGAYLDLSRYIPPRVTRQIKYTISPEKNKRTEILLKLGGEQGGKLPAGVYYLDLLAPEIRRANPNNQEAGHVRQLLIVATANLTIKVAPDEILAWVTDLKTGQPVQGVQIGVYGQGRQTIGSGTSDASGLVRIKAGTNRLWPYEAYTVIASGNGAFSVGNSQWMNDFRIGEFEDSFNDPEPRKERVYLYTDQPVYRPGRPVYFRGIARSQDDVNFSVPAGAQVQVIVNDQQGKEFFKKTLALNTFGAFSDKLDLPQNAPLGQYNLRVNYKNQESYLAFSVAEYRPPEFLVNATPNAPEVAAGDTIKVTVDAKFLFGGPVSDGTLNWVAIANQGFFNFLGEGGYDFFLSGPYRGSYVYQRQVGQGTGKLDDKGQFVIELPADLGQNPVQQIFTIEATVRDVSNQQVSGRTSVTVHPATVYIGLAPAAYVGTAGKPLDVNVTAVDWASQPQAGQNIAMKVVERRWQQDPNTLQWSQKTTDVAEGRVTTDAKGKAVFTFTPPRAGVYEIEGTTRDPRERIARTATTVWVQGQEFIPWNRDDKSIQLVADKKSYNPGDTASILIPSPFPEPVQALVTVERAGIMKAEIVTITGSATYKLPLDVVHAPNVYVSVALVRGGGEKNIPPDVRYGLINLAVSVKQQLKIKITPSTARAAPGETVKLDLLITDLEGKPVAAEVGLSMSDLANLSVGSANSQPIFGFFWSARGLSIITSSPLAKLIDDLKPSDTVEEAQVAMSAPAPAGGIMAAAPTMTARDAKNGDIGAEKAADGRASGQRGQQPAPRTNFVDTPLWLPALASGLDGKATASVTLPDNLTTWRLDARGISAQTYVGDGTLDVLSTKPLLVRPATPRFFVVGDEAELAMVVNNNTDQDLAVQVALDAKGVTLKAASKQTINIPKGGRQRIAWLAKVEDVEAVDLVFSAVSGQFSDASKPAVGIGDQRLLPVYKYLSPDYVSTAGALTKPGSRTEAVILPPTALAPTGELTINLQPSLAATTLDGLKYLRNFSYQCVEQTVSKFLPNVITFRALQKLGLEKPELRAQLNDAVQYAVARLQREQKPDGGWGWFPADQSNPLVSTYALLGLLEARASDLAVDKTMIDRATAYVLSTLRPVNDGTPAYELNRLSFTLLVVAKAGSPNPRLMDDLFTRREKMSVYARAYLAQTYNQIKGDASKLATLLSDLQSKAIASATGIHWEESWRDWWNWDSNTRSTAIVLKTLVELTPQSELIPNVVRWLMVARRGDAWESTQETAWAVMALTDWMFASGELKADYAYTINVNGKQIGDGKANPDTIRDTKTLQVAVANLLREQVNRIVVDHGTGAGALYYTATLHVNQPVEAIKPTNRGLALTRTYYLDGKPVTSARVGDTLTVALEITATSDLYYVNINDPIPAGTEALDRSLQTTAQVGQRPELRLLDPAGAGYRYRWGWWWFSNTELRTEKVVLSATYLPRGVYRFVYDVTVTTPGVYRVIPPNGNEFYFPEVFGRGAGSLFTVTE